MIRISEGAEAVACAQPAGQRPRPLPRRQNGVPQIDRFSSRQVELEAILARVPGAPRQGGYAGQLAFDRSARRLFVISVVVLLLFGLITVRSERGIDLSK